MNPNDRYGFTNNDIETTTDLDRVRQVLNQSRVFKDAAEALRNAGITTPVTIDPNLPVAGRTYGGPADTERPIAINPSEIPDDGHVGDVYAHEFGHVWEDHGGPPADRFVSQVNRELGIRERPPSHSPLPTTRDPFAPPGTRGHAEKEYERLDDAKKRGVHLAGNCWCGKEHVAGVCSGCGRPLDDGTWHYHGH